MRTRQSSSQPAHSSYNICSNARKSYLWPVLNWAKQKLFLLSPKGPAMIGGPSPGWLQVSPQRGPAHVCTGWEAEGISCLLTASVKLMLPLLKHKSIKKMWLSQKSSPCFPQAPLRHTASPQWVHRGCCTQSKHTAPAPGAGSHRGAALQLNPHPEHGSAWF